jgi:hypothetical protein
MNILRSRSFWGVIFIIGGLLYLLQALDVIQGGDIFWGLFFLLVGGLFLSAYWNNRSQWWFIVPGTLFLGIGASALSEAILPDKISSAIGGMFVLGGLGIGFCLIYLLFPANWWAILPGGMFISLAVVSVLDEVFPDKDTGGVFLIGLGLSFALLYILPRLRMTWALIPAAVLIVIGFIPLIGQFPIVNYIWPLLLILAGLFVLVRGMGYFRS